MQLLYKAITIRQPWAQYCVRWRRGEVRPWKTTYRGPLVIHASLKIDPAYRDTLRNLDVPLGTLVGIVELVDCERVRSERAWREIRRDLGEEGSRPYGADTTVWRFANCREFMRPIPWKGRLGLFEIPAAVIRRAGVRRDTSRKP